MNRWLRAVAGSLLLTLATALPAQAAEETPWQILSAGAWLMKNLTWPNYNAGFDFTPTANGTITKLGGLFNGAKTVRLYDTQSRAIIAQASVTGNNSWQYRDITPVRVVAGKRYTIAVNTGFTGASMSYGIGFPDTPVSYGNITVERSVFAFGAQLPVNEVWNQMWGQPDFVFVADPIVQP